MKSEMITQRILTADEGMFLTNGETYGKTVVLPVDVDYTVWREVAEGELFIKDESDVNG
jgi:hypothetical protein